MTVHIVLYPADLTREAFDADLVAHPRERGALAGPYAVAVRDEAERRAIPVGIPPVYPDKL